MQQEPMRKTFNQCIDKKAPLKGLVGRANLIIARVKTLIQLARFFELTELFKIGVKIAHMLGDDTIHGFTFAGGFHHLGRDAVMRQICAQRSARLRSV